MIVTLQLSVRTAVTQLTLVVLIAACIDQAVAPLDLVRPIAIVSGPAPDTLRVYDSVVLRVAVQPGDSAPTTLRWSVLPRGDSAVADSFVFHPAGAGTEIVRVVAEFSGGAVGVAERRFVTRRNQAPSAVIRDIAPLGSAVIPVGDSVQLLGTMSDADGDSITARWVVESPESLATILGTDDTLRWLPALPATYFVALEVDDPAGARAITRFLVEVYDPMVPSVWRRPLNIALEFLIPGGLHALAQQPTGLVVARTASGIAAIGDSGQVVWEFAAPPGAGPLTVAPDGSAYFVPSRGTLSRLSPVGALLWTLPPDSVASGPQNGPAIMADGSAVFPAFSVSGQQVETNMLRRVSAAGVASWTNSLAECLYWRLIPAVARDSVIYIQTRPCVSFSGPYLLALSADGTRLWSTKLGPGVINSFVVNPGPVVIADDSTILAGADSLRAVAPDGTIRWVSGGAVDEIVVGLGAAYTVGGGLLRAFDLATGTQRWQAAPVFGGLALTANGAVLGYVNRDIVAFDATTGVEQWRHRMGSAVSEFLITDDGRLLASDLRGFLETIALPLLPLNSPWPQAGADAQRSHRVRGP